MYDFSLPSHDTHINETFKSILKILYKYTYFRFKKIWTFHIYSRTSIIRTSIIRISRLSGLLLWSQFGYDYLLVPIKIRSHILFKTTALKGAVKCKGFLLSKSKGSARACRKEGDIGIFGFGNFFIRFFGFCAKRLRFFGFCAKRLRFFGFCAKRLFRFWCSFRFTDFSFFSIRFWVFVENNSGFSVLLSNVVFGFSYFESKWGFRFWPNFLAVLDDFFFGFAVSNIMYPNAPLRK